MRHLTLHAGAAVALSVIVASAAVYAQGQTAAPSAAATRATAKPWTPPRTPAGQPNLQGVWDFSTITPLQRPPSFAGREFLTDQEVADIERQAAVRSAASDVTPEGDLPKGGAVGAYNSFWLGRGTTVVATKRTSIIVDPPDGRVPPLTPAAQAAWNKRDQTKQHPAGPEDLDLIDRCMTGFNTGPPMIPDIYNNTVQIIQSRDQVVLLNEMVHNARIVPVNGRPHLSASIQQWIGDSRGRWDGNTLVVDTTNFSDDGVNFDFIEFVGPGHFRGFGSRQVRVTERFSLLNANVLLYEFTFDDPTTYTKPWSGSLTMTRLHNKVYEYACHEGNYGLTNLLLNARAEDKQRPGTR